MSIAGKESGAERAEPGSPGCWLLYSIDHAVVLLGQWALLHDPAAGNPPGSVVSDAVMPVVGL